MSPVRRDRERLERELRDAERDLSAANDVANQLRTALDAVPMGVVLGDSSGSVVVRNRAAHLDGHADALVSEVVDRMLTLATEGREVSEEVSLFGPPQRVLSVVGRPLDGGGALVTIEDHSDRVRIDAVRTDFVANISHELKTPVGALAVLAEALADVDDLETARHLAARMVDEAHRASSTIDDLLELSRIELAGVQDPQAVRVRQVCDEAVARLRLSAATAGVGVVVECPDTLVVVGDERQLVSAVSNLVDNAVKYSERGGTVTLAASTDDTHVTIVVRDEGVGIPTRDLDRIFERFYRVDRARRRETGGTGLGLAIVRHVANNHGGTVSVASHEGEGSTFSLLLPKGDAS